MAMNEQLFDEGERKNKGGFLSKLVSVGFKKKQQADATPMIDSNYSNIELNSNTEIDDNLGIKEPDIETQLKHLLQVKNLANNTARHYLLGLKWVFKQALSNKVITNIPIIIAIDFKLSKNNAHS